MDQDASEAEPLLHPAAESANQSAFFLSQADQFENIVDCFFALSGRNFVTGAEEVEILGDFHVFVDAKKIGHIADDMADGVGVANDIVTEHPSLPSGGSE